MKTPENFFKWEKLEHMCFLGRVSNRKGKLKMQKRGGRKPGILGGFLGGERGYNLHYILFHK